MLAGDDQQGVRQQEDPPPATRRCARGGARVMRLNAQPRPPVGGTIGPEEILRLVLELLEAGRGRNEGHTTSFSRLPAVRNHRRKGGSAHRDEMTSGLSPFRGPEATGSPGPDDHTSEWGLSSEAAHLDPPTSPARLQAPGVPA